MSPDIDPHATPHPAPPWLAERLRWAGGAVAFQTYMEWVLHDPVHGAYGAGRLRIGPRGDFATAPSLGPDFAALLAPQLAQWLQALSEQSGMTSGPGSGRPLALVESGPGEGHLARQLAEALAAGWPELAALTELVMVEPNPGMAERQRHQLRELALPVRWCSFADLARQPLVGVVLAHEVLDALAVERVERVAQGWCRQRVALRSGQLVLEPGDRLESEALSRLEALGLLPLDQQRPQGWCSEMHPGLHPWLADCGAALARGQLLVIDYALEAWRYYAPQRSRGTLMAYRHQQASDDPLRDPGQWDLTCHLCIDSLVEAAAAGGWQLLGMRRQGEALLALGLAERLHGLQHQGGTAAGGKGSGTDLATLLARREALLRLVDPAALGDFRWLAFQRGVSDSAVSTPLFLREPGAPRS